MSSNREEEKSEKYKIIEPEVPVRDLEEDFDKMILGIIPEDINVREKLRELGPFEFNKNNRTQGLELVEGVKDGTETYYGFVYSSIFIIVIPILKRESIKDL